MKRLLIALVVFCVSFGVFGADLKLAAGVSGGVVATKQTITLSDASATLDSTQDVNLATFGAFFDAQYVVLSVVGQTQLGKSKVTSTVQVTGFGSVTNSADYDDQILSLDCSLFGKYPLQLGPLVVFPMVGVEYMPNLTIKDKDKATSEQKGELDDWYASLGCGLDIPVTSVLFLRAQAVYGLNLTTTMKSAQDLADLNHLSLKTSGNSMAGSLAIGYKL